MHEYCPIDVSNELIEEINKLDGYKVWFKGVTNTTGDNIPLAIAIELPLGEQFTIEKKLFNEYGLLKLFNEEIENYNNSYLNEYLCNIYNLNCERK